MLSHKIEIESFKKIFYFNEKLKFNILKIPEKYILQKNKCIMFYYRKKTN